MFIVAFLETKAATKPSKQFCRSKTKLRQTKQCPLNEHVLQAMLRILHPRWVRGWDWDGGVAHQSDLQDVNQSGMSPFSSTNVFHAIKAG